MPRNTLRSEQGWVAVTAIIMLAIMMMLGLTMMAGVDTGSKRTREQRERESAFTLTEGVLYMQSHNLAQQWPAGQNPSYPARCQATVAPTGTAETQCPTPATLASSTGNFTGPDYLRDVDWVTRVRDNFGQLSGAYDPAFADGALTDGTTTCAAPCSRDYNGDRQLWVQARAIAQGQPRNVVALMKLEQLQESMPQVAIASGAIKTTNQGNHGNTPLVDGSGSDIRVRCTPDQGSGNNATCTSYKPGQVSPQPEGGAPNRLMTNDQIQRFAETAKVNGTYYTGCPPDEAIQGAVVFVEFCDPAVSGTAYQGNKPPYSNCGPNMPQGMQVPCKNSINQPGLLIFRCGGMNASGNWTYVGIIYFANNIDGKCAGGTRGNYKCEGSNVNSNDVFISAGGFGVWGVLAAEGGACMKFGSNNFQFKYDAAVFDSLVSYGTVGLVQNTWRELPPATSF